MEEEALKGMDHEEFEMACIDAGAEDFHHDEEGFIILAPYTEFGSINRNWMSLLLKPRVQNSSVSTDHDPRRPRYGP